MYQTDEKQWAEQDILLTLHHVATPEDFAAVTGLVSDLEGFASARWYNSLRAVAWLPEDGFSSEFEERGGFAAVEQKISGPQIPLLRDGERRVNISILGLDEATFATYCAALGLDPAPFYEENQWRGILYHTVNDVSSSTKRNPVPIPFLDVAVGDHLTLSEKRTDDAQGDFYFDMEIAAISDRMPPLGDAMFGVRYSAVQVLPMSQVRQLDSHFAQANAVQVSSVIQVSAPDQITPIRTEIEQICESYFGSGDYELLDESEYYAHDAIGRTTTAMLFGFVVGLLAIIGLSNAWSTVRGTLNARRREFAMLRSVGLPPNGLRRMLSLEAFMLGMMPILIGLPVVILLQGIFLSINEVSFLEWLPFAPWIPLLLYIVAVLGITMAAYATGGRRLLNENIIQAIKVDSI